MKNKFLATGIKLSAALSMLLVTGCAELYKRALDDTQANGPAFSQMLAKEYETLGNTEQAVMYDEPSATNYFRKAIRAKKGCPVMPNVLEEYNIESEKLPALTKARARLMLALEHGAWEVSPEMSAHAQAYFDCWVEQQAEAWQKEDIANCRAEFYEAIADVELMLMTSIFPSRKVFFDFGSSHINAKAITVIDEVAIRAKTEGLSNRILLIGRTDHVGDPNQNKYHAAYRAKMVKDALVRRGVSPLRIFIKSAGDKPGSKVDSDNRRVDIIFLGYK